MDNPFTSPLFVRIWSKHFNNSKKAYEFDFINNVSFYRTLFLPLFINIGKNLTKGIHYTLNYVATDYKNKVFLIYDVPEFFEVEEFDDTRSNLRRTEIFQYKGFLLNFKNFPTAEDYIKSRISAKNRRGLRSRQERLEKCFDIRYIFYSDNISKSDFDILFDKFHVLLSKRFAEKEIHYHHLRKDKWAFHRELVYEMMQRKEASLFVIYEREKPIAITLNVNSETIVFVSITVFDPDYYKFNIGKTTIVKIIEWCYENNKQIADFSKGDFDFKHEWCNEIYDFHYHVFHDSGSLLSRFMAWKIELYLRFKQYLRKHNANVLYRKLLYQLKSSEERLDLRAKYSELSDFEPNDTYVMVDCDDKKFRYFRKHVYSFLFVNSDHLDAVKVYKRKGKKREFVIKGNEKIQKVLFD